MNHIIIWRLRAPGVELGGDCSSPIQSFSDVANREVSVSLNPGQVGRKELVLFAPGVGGACGRFPVNLKKLNPTQNSFIKVIHTLLKVLNIFTGLWAIITIFC